MRLRFLGLITHALVANKNVVVLFNHADHKPRLRVREGDIDGKPNTANTIKCFELKDKVVSFAGLSGTVNRVGLLPVPSLSLIGGSGGVPHGHLAARKTGGVFTSFIELAGGDYGIEDWFKFKGTFNGGKDFICIPRTILFDTTVNATTVVNGLGVALTLKPQAVVTITNLEDKLTPPHFSTYETFFDPRKTLLVPSDAAQRRCADGTSIVNVPLCPNELQQFAGVECSNTSYP